VATRLQCDVNGAILSRTIKVPQCIDFGMCITEPSMPTFGHHRVLTSDDTSDHRIGLDMPFALLGKL
jgi:hypothetical protein